MKKRGPPKCLVKGQSLQSKRQRKTFSKPHIKSRFRTSIAKKAISLSFANSRKKLSRQIRRPWICTACARTLQRTSVGAFGCNWRIVCQTCSTTIMAKKHTKHPLAVTVIFLRPMNQHVSPEIAWGRLIACCGNCLLHAQCQALGNDLCLYC